MNKRFVQFLIACLFLVVMVVPVGAQHQTSYEVAGIADATEFEKAFTDLQRAIAIEERDTVTDYISYPLRFNEGEGKYREFATKEEVLAEYEQLFTPKVKEAFREQQISTLFVNYQGVMVGNGEAWLRLDKKIPYHYGICTINGEPPVVELLSGRVF